MKVSLNNSLCFQMNNRRIGKVNEPGVNGLFSNSIALEAEKVKGDQYIGHSVSQPPKLEDDDYDYLASKWEPTPNTTSRNMESMVDVNALPTACKKMKHALLTHAKIIMQR